MSKELIINLESKTDEAIKGIQETKKEIQDLNKEVTKGNKNTVSGLKDVEASSSATAGGVKKNRWCFQGIGYWSYNSSFCKIHRSIE